MPGRICVAGIDTRKTPSWLGGAAARSAGASGKHLILHGQQAIREIADAMPDQPGSDSM
jgi:hypothetical protein